MAYLPTNMKLNIFLLLLKNQPIPSIIITIDNNFLKCTTNYSKVSSSFLSICTNYNVYLQLELIKRNTVIIILGYSQNLLIMVNFWDYSWRHLLLFHGLGSCESTELTDFCRPLSKDHIDFQEVGQEE